MSIIGCYSLNLYCDNEEAHFIKRQPWQQGYYDLPLFETLGRSQTECFNKARKAGWTIDIKNHITRCPNCRRRRIQRRKD